MADLGLEWNDDFRFTPSGDVSLVTGEDEARQRIIRRLYTALGGYVWDAEYGAGLPQKIGSTYQPQQIESIVRGQMLLEESVSQIPPPRIQVSSAVSGLQVIVIEYRESGTNREIGFTIEV